MLSEGPRVVVGADVAVGADVGVGVEVGAADGWVDPQPASNAMATTTMSDFIPPGLHVQTAGVGAAGKRYPTGQPCSVGR
jgi:hypothetical protein